MLLGTLLRKHLASNPGYRSIVDDDSHVDPTASDIADPNPSTQGRASH